MTAGLPYTGTSGLSTLYSVQTCFLFSLWCSEASSRLPPATLHHDIQPWYASRICRLSLSASTLTVVVVAFSFSCLSLIPAICSVDVCAAVKEEISPDLAVWALELVQLYHTHFTCSISEAVQCTILPLDSAFDFEPML